MYGHDRRHIELNRAAHVRPHPRYRLPELSRAPHITTERSSAEFFHLCGIILEKKAGFMMEMTGAQEPFHLRSSARMGMPFIDDPNTSRERYTRELTLFVAPPPRRIDVIVSLCHYAKPSTRLLPEQSWTSMGFAGAAPENFTLCRV